MKKFEVHLLERLNHILITTASKSNATTNVRTNTSPNNTPIRTKPCNDYDTSAKSEYNSNSETKTDTETSNSNLQAIKPPNNRV